MKYLLTLSIGMCCLFFLSFPLFSNEINVIVELNDGSVLKGTVSNSNLDNDPLEITTSFGKLSVKKNKINSLYLKKDLGIKKEKKVKVKSLKSDKNKDLSIETTTPDKLLNMDDDSLLRLLSNSKKPVLPKPSNEKNIKQKVKDLYTFDDEKGSMTPPTVTEVKILDKKIKKMSENSSKINVINNKIDKLMGKTKEIVLKKIKKEASKSKKDNQSSKFKKYVPKKGTIDSKIYKKIEKNGGIVLTDEDFKKLKKEEIDKLLEKHIPEDEKITQPKKK